jgi:pyruvate dehydrogenase E1 component beta subunit
MAQITLVEAVNLALKREMERDPAVVVLGEDVGVDGGVFRATLGLIERFGPERVIDTPLAEALITGMAIGMAVEGLRPVAEIQFAGFGYTAIDQIVNHAGRMRHRSQGRLSCPMVLRMPCGAGIHAPEHHSESPEAMFAHIPGIRVVYPSSPRRAYGLLLAAIRDPDPVVFLEPTRLYRLFKEEFADDGQAAALDACYTAREGGDVTVVAWGAMVHESLAAADVLAEQGVAAEVLDVATEAARTCSFASEIAAGLAEEGLLSLLAPVQRVTGYDVVVPLPRLEHGHMPGKERIVAAVRKTLAFG